jgi:hypothetical protein
MHMKRICIVAAFACWWTGVFSAHAQEVDRLLAAVNGRVITEWDLRMARSLNAVLETALERGKSRAKPSHEEEMDRLIDRELLRQELENFPVEQGDPAKVQASLQAAVQAILEDLKQAYAEIGGLSALLRQLGLQESELVSYVRLQILIVRFTSMRFDPFVTVADAEVDTYYTMTLVPELKQAGAEVPPLTEVAARIQEILREEKKNTALENWIANIRSHSRIEIYANAPYSGGKERP